MTTFAHLGRTYFTSFRGYGGVFHTMLLLEGLALLVCVAHCCRTIPSQAPAIVRLIVVAALGAAMVNLTFFAEEVLETGDPLARFAGTLIEARWSAHVGDANAAASFFGMAMFIAIGLALEERRGRFTWAAGGLILALAFWMTGSRTALVAAVLIALLSITVVTLRRRLYTTRTTLVVTATMLGVRYSPLLGSSFRPSHLAHQPGLP